MEAHIAGFAGKHYCPRMATMNKPCYAALREHAPRKPALIFVASRRQTRLTALDLISLAAADDDFSGASWLDAEYAVDVEDAARRARDPALRHSLPFGVGVHHGGLCESDRDAVEKLFEKGAIRVLVCTATLAWGVNFPARLVIVKGTEFYDAKIGGYVDFPVTDVLQMMGRAGRPQFDDVGVACIFVHAPKKEFYKKFLYEPFPVESKLAGALHDHVMAEVCLSGSVKSVADCVTWLKWTYLYRRLRQNPSYYGVDDNSDDAVAAYLEATARSTLADLDAAGAVDVQEDDVVVPATLGRVASYYYLDHRTTRDAAVSVDAVDEALSDDSSRRAEGRAIAFLCAAREFEDLPVRHNEDVENAELAASLFKDDGDLGADLASLGYDSPHAKAQLLVHARLRDAPLPVADYATDTRSVFDQTNRVLAALVDVAADAGCLNATLALGRLSQALSTNCAGHRDALCQLPGVSEKEAAALRRRLGLKSSRSSALEALVSSGKIDGLSNAARDFLRELPAGRTTLKASVASDGAPARTVSINAELDVSATLRSPAPRRRGQRGASFWLALADGDELIALKKVQAAGVVEATLVVEAPDEAVDDWRMTLYAVYDRARGFDAVPVELPGLRVVVGDGKSPEASALSAGAAAWAPSS
mmetsp:Transcript_27474/g.84792  ORF Transcript_27474/g.84792 Transcript_27474/m.84792 type:complete len:648 (-) Transcript_27474:279-2222(-)